MVFTPDSDTVLFDPKFITLVTELRDVARLFYHHAIPLRLPAKQVFFWHRFANNTSYKRITEEPYMLQMTDIQHVSLAIQPADAAGNAAPVQNTVWSAADPTMFTVNPSPDGLSCDGHRSSPDRYRSQSSIRRPPPSRSRLALLATSFHRRLPRRN